MGSISILFTNKAIRIKKSYLGIAGIQTRGSWKGSKNANFVLGSPHNDKK